MDRVRALAVLGLAEGSAPGEVRARYLELLREHHPDVAGTSSTATAQAITEAYRVVRSTAPPPPPEPPVLVVADGDTLVLELPPDEAFLRLLDVASLIGEVTYVDPDVGLLETIITVSTGVTCSLVLSLQGRAATGRTDAFCTVAALGLGDAPPAEQLVAELAALVATAG